jgi:hypothetical protein
MRGRAYDPTRTEFAKRYGLNECQRRKLTAAFIEQLRHCRSEDARRVLLGRGRRYKKKS